MLNRITNSAAPRELSQLASEVGGSANIQRLFRFATQQVNPRLSVKSLRLQTAPGQKPAEVAFAEHKVVLLHLVDQLAAGFAQPQCGPTILDRFKTRCESLGCTIEIGCFHGIAENL